jgi:hypothetical protein
MEMKHLFMMKMFGGLGRMVPIIIGHTGLAGIQAVVTAVMVIMVGADIMEVDIDGVDLDRGVADGEEVVLMAVVVEEVLVVRLELAEDQVV